ncbi:MAG: thymidine phosphorylase [Phototrophicales bacterium]|nr:thymidine phosphorylase [Phototrophicales bacterium]
MRAVDIIAKKRDGLVLTNDEIEWFITAYTHNDVHDYQASALLMAILLRGMTDDEVTTLTMAMANSGVMLDLSDISPYVVDKHSSGGVGDKTTLVVLPLVASCGVTCAKMSGRGLGYTGGTLDKLEAITGFRVEIPESEFREQARRIGIALVGQTTDLAPADGKMYALRDVTATVSSIPLIASSIMSKKLASGANGIVLDVKVGTGAFIKNLDDGHALARMMVKIGQNVGRDMIAVISDMNQPLGHAIGNAIEIEEAIETLKGGGPEDFRDHCIEVAAHMLRLAALGMGDKGKKWRDFTVVLKFLQDQLHSGAALEKFRELVIAQGGDVAMVDNPSLLPQAKIVQRIQAERDGVISMVDAEKVALAAFELGAGRAKKGDPIDHAVGVKILVKVGDMVKKGDIIGSIHANDSNHLANAKATMREAIAYSKDMVQRLPLFYDVIGEV